MTPDLRTDERGFTLIEVMVAALVLVVGLMGTLALVNAANARSTASQGREGATNVAREISEQARTISFQDLRPAVLATELQSRPGLADASPGTSGWQLVRRKRTYTVQTTVCSIDDPGDKLGVHGADFCAGGPAPGTEDAVPEDLKRVVTQVSFTEPGGKVTTSRVASTFNSSGQANGLPVLTLELSSPTVTIGTPTEPVINTAETTLAFRATTGPAATRVIWSVDGTRQTTDATRVNSTTWSFSWPITGLSDGPYVITAQAIDATGEIGPPRDVTVQLARQGAQPPPQVAGGYNSIFVGGTAKVVTELQWLASNERNVTGYRVYRPGTSTPVCETSAAAADPAAATSCVDLTPPAETASDADRTYSVRSVFRDATGAVQQSAPRTVLMVPRSNSQTAVTPTPTAHAFKLQTTSDTGPNCYTGGAGRLGMLDNQTSGTSTTYGVAGNALTWCSPAYTLSGVDVRPQTATFVANYTSTLNGQKSCAINYYLSVNGTTQLSPTQTLSWGPNTPNGARTVSFPIAATTPLAMGDRLNLTVYWASADCGAVKLTYGGTAQPGTLNVTSTRTAPAPIPTTNTQPAPPSALTATTQADGTVRLQWSASTTTPIEFYRIYKDGKDYTQRVATDGEGTATEEWYDTNPGGVHDYYVTAVSSQLYESTTVGPARP